MNIRLLSGSIVCALMMFYAGCGPSSKLSTSEKRNVVKDMEQTTLERLYREEPLAEEKIDDAPGYGVFSNANINLIFASAGGGYGVVVDNKTGKRTYMKMALGGIGLGLGAKDYRQVLIFKQRCALEKFVESGWDFGAHADAAAKASDKGGEMSGEGNIAEDIEVYSLTESGLALQATLTGAKYWKYDELN